MCIVQLKNTFQFRELFQQLRFVRWFFFPNFTCEIHASQLNEKYACAMCNVQQTIELECESIWMISSCLSGKLHFPMPQYVTHCSVLTFYFSTFMIEPNSYDRNAICRHFKHAWQIFCAKLTVNWMSSHFAFDMFTKLSIWIFIEINSANRIFSQKDHHNYVWRLTSNWKWLASSMNLRHKITIIIRGKSLFIDVIMLMMGKWAPSVQAN